MQWWHMPLIEEVPRKIAPALDFISTQHAEEQYFHPVTVANMVNLWRTPGKPLWCYGNTTWMEEGTGAQMHRDFFAALLRATSRRHE